MGNVYKNYFSRMLIDYDQSRVELLVMCVHCYFLYLCALVYCSDYGERYNAHVANDGGVKVTCVIDVSV